VLANLRAQEWQANLRVPPGLAVGPHQVRLRTAGSSYSNPFQILMQHQSTWGAGFIPRGASAPQAVQPEINQLPPVIYEVTNGMTESDVFHGHRNEYVCCRFRTSEPGLDRDNVILLIDDIEQSVVFLTDLGGGCWQANSRLPAALEQGQHSVRIRTVRSTFGAPGKILFQPTGS
jgi:hypothetical protein